VNNCRTFLLLVVVFFSLFSAAAPLGTIPTIEEQSMRLLLSLRSDLWTSPYTYKESPIRIFGGEFRVPIYTAETWAVSASVSDES
jgi:hypothetical protein